MLSNAYFLAKFRFDTAENEPAKKLQKFAKFANFADPNPLTLTQSRKSRGDGRREGSRGSRDPLVRLPLLRVARLQSHFLSKILQNVC